MTDRRQVLQEAEKALTLARKEIVFRLKGNPTLVNSSATIHGIDSALALIRASLAEADPVPEASVLTRSEPTEADAGLLRRIRDVALEIRAGGLRGNCEADALADSDALYRAADLLQAALPVPADRSGEDAIEIIRAIAPMAKNDAMMMEAMSRHQPVPGTETPEFGAQADDGMLAVNRAFAFIGEPEPFAIAPPLLSLKGEGK